MNGTEHREDGFLSAGATIRPILEVALNVGVVVVYKESSKSVWKNNRNVNTNNHIPKAW
jgi:hypothetical protein